jgi:hypothetical protein
MNIYRVTIFLLLMAACEDGATPELKNQQVKLLAPANNVISSDSVQTFYWEELGDSLRYQLQIVSPGFDSIVRLEADTILRRNRLTLKLRSDTYQWRVRAMNSVANSKFSEVFRLIIR